MTGFRLFIILAIIFMAPQARAAGEPFVPTSGWLVGPATILPVSEASFSMPCVMMNSFNNGYVLRLSGGGGKIFAMAADFRQDAFEKGREYDVEIGVDSEFEQRTTAVAHNKGTVLINLQKQDGLYEALRGGKTLSLAVSSGKFEFAMLGVKDGLARMEECYKPNGHTRKITAPSDAPDESAMNREPREDAIPPAYSKAVIPPPPRGEIEEDEPEMAAAVPAPRAPVPAAVPQPKKTDKSADDMAQKMAQLDSMIAMAAKKLAALEPASGAAAPAAAPVAIPAAPAVKTTHLPAQPIGRPLAGTWVSPKKSEGLMQRDITAVPQQPVAVPLPQQPVQPVVQPVAHPIAAAAIPQQPTVSHERRWRAIGGTNLHEVLDVWARHENARLIWQAETELSVRESVSMQGSFEEAVQVVLQQYADSSRRPVGRIYVDPALNQKVLLVESAGNF